MLVDCTDMITNGISAAKRQDDILNRKSNGKEVSWTRKRLLEVHNLGTRSTREVRGVFEVDTERRGRGEQSDSPKDQAQSNRTSSFKDGSRYRSVNSNSEAGKTCPIRQEY